MNVLVIGGTGSIGPYVVRRLAQKSHRLTVFHRGKTPADLPPDVNPNLGARDDMLSFSDQLNQGNIVVAVDMTLYDEAVAPTTMLKNWWWARHESGSNSAIPNPYPVARVWLAPLNGSASTSLRTSTRHASITRSKIK